MFPNSSELRLEKDVKKVVAVSKIIKTTVVPVNMQRITSHSFLYSDVKEHLSTHIIQCSFDEQYNFKQQTVEQFMGEYEYSCFAEDYSFLSNREGDIASYDHLSKDTVFVEKQHPSMFHPLQMHTVGELFLTCGGNIRNSQGDNEKIVKLWRPTGEGELEMRCRIVTGHNRPIDNSLVLGRNRVITLSSDLTVRSINLCTQQTEAIFPVSMGYYSGCEVDWNSAILGGIGPNLSIFDFRGRKVIAACKLPFNVTQISAFTRINTHHYLFANANAIYRLDIRKMTAEKVGEHEGERISAIKVLGPDALLLANHDKSLQVWQVCD